MVRVSFRGSFHTEFAATFPKKKKENLVSSASLKKSILISIFFLTISIYKVAILGNCIKWVSKLRSASIGAIIAKR